MAKSNTSSSTALVVLESAKLAAPKLARIQKTAKKQFQVIARAERETPMRAIFFGMALKLIKNTMEHGQFQSWMKANVTQGNFWTEATAKKNASYYTRLAQVAIEHCAGKDVVNIEEAAALVDPKKGKGAFFTKLAEFVGEKSLNELLREHGIKDAAKLGGARPQIGTGANSEAPDSEQLYLFARDEIGGVIQRAEELFLKENRLQHLVDHPEEVRGVVESLRALADKVEAAAKPLLRPSAK